MNRAGARDPATTDPVLIREDIARTRRELGLTVEALVARADVKARAREKAGEARKRATVLAAGPAGRIALGIVLGAGVVLLARLVREWQWR
ncbi:MAG TPA: DUF3618 domain-containing protein [Micromonosporaceae bacterium]